LKIKIALCLRDIKQLTKLIKLKIFFEEKMKLYKSLLIIPFIYYSFDITGIPHFCCASDILSLEFLW